MGAHHVWYFIGGTFVDVSIDCYWRLPTVVYNELMVILIHVIIALASIAVASFVYFKPTITRLITSYGFILATVASGTLLLLSSPSNILKSCLVGLAYLTAVSIVTIATHIRIQKYAKVRIDS